jgi:class 3 adenylate cyclase
MKPERPVVEQVAGMKEHVDTFKSFVIYYDGRAFFDYGTSELLVVGRAYCQGVGKFVIIRHIGEAVYGASGSLDHAWKCACDARDEMVQSLREKLGSGSTGWDGIS